jgi:CRP/FNR family cyclic AMP-dependent transcriptional regulator
VNTSWSKAFGYRRQKDKGELGLADILTNISVFEDLSKRELASVQRILHQRNYEPGEVIFRQEEPGMGMYIIHSGTVTIISEPEGLLLSELSDGDFFGEMALLDESPRSATAIAKTSCRLFGFFQPELFGLIERDSRLGTKIVLRLARIMAARLRNANEQAFTLNRELQEIKAGTKVMSK